MSLKDQQKKSLQQFYELREADVKKLQAEVAPLIESGDFSLAAMKCRELADRLEALNSTANQLADTL